MFALFFYEIFVFIFDTKLILHAIEQRKPSKRDIYSNKILMDLIICIINKKLDQLIRFIIILSISFKIIAYKYSRRLHLLGPIK